MISIKLTTSASTIILLSFGVISLAAANLASHPTEGATKCNALEPDQLDSKYQMERDNIAKIREFYEDIFTHKDVNGAADKLISPKEYIEHNPHQEDGLQGFKTTMKKLTAASPGQTMDIRRIIADGDFVVVHGKTSWLGHDVAFVDIYQMEAGKIIEHWDVIQPLPTETTNPHPMF